MMCLGIPGKVVEDVDAESRPRQGGDRRRPPALSRPRSSRSRRSATGCSSTSGSRSRASTRWRRARPGVAPADGRGLRARARRHQGERPMRCITCSDEAFVGRVVEIDGATAVVAHEGERAEVALDLVEPVDRRRPPHVSRGDRPAQAGAGAMRFVDEYRDPDLAREIAAELKEIVQPGRVLQLMEVCGGHTHAIDKHGIDEPAARRGRARSRPRLPRLRDRARTDRRGARDRAPARRAPRARSATCCASPGAAARCSTRSAQGADVRMVYSPLDALDLARRNPERRSSSSRSASRRRHRRTR